jgi:hypothetical protein
LVAFAIITRDWLGVLGGVLGLALAFGLAVLFIVEPRLWEPRNRWRVLAIFVLVGTLLMVSIFGLMAFLSE